GGLEYTVLKGDEVYMKLNVVCWGPSWKWFSLGEGEVQDSGGRRSYRQVRKIGGTDKEIALTHSFRRGDGGQAILSYELSAPEAAELTQIIVSIKPGDRLFRPGKCTAVMADGTRKAVDLPFGRGPIGDAVEALVFTDSAGAEVQVNIAPARNVSMDGEARITLVGKKMAAGETRSTRLTVDLPQSAQVHTSRETTIQRNATEDWFPYPTGPEGVPIDLSFLNKDAEGNYVPAGGHGFLTADGDRLVFEDGTPARFWGLNVTAGAALSSPERAEQIARRLARLGLNVVRFHHLDSWANPIIDYDHPDGTTQHLDPESMRRLDKILYELKRHGIYVVLDPWVQRCFKEADGVEDYGHLGQRGNFNLHPYIYFDDRMQELIQKQWRQVWTHENEFTGLAYKDDPAVIMTEVINEGLMIGLDGVTQPNYRQEVLDLYEQWAEEHDGLPAQQANIFGKNFGENNVSFLMWLHRRFYDKSHAFFRQIGVRIPINATNWAHFTWVMAAQAGQDFMDCHHYYAGNQIGPGHGMGGLWVSHPPGLPGAPFGKIGGFAVAGKPVASSECGNNPPKTYRAAYQFGLAAVAALQGWDCFTGYAFSQSGRPRDTLSAFEWETDPVTLASVAAGALLFRRGDVSPAEQTVVLRLPEQELYKLRWQDGGAKQHWNTAGFNAALEQHRVVVELPGQSTEGLDPARVLSPEDCWQYEHPGTVLESDTGQLWRDWELGVGTLDTPRSQAAYGNLGKSGRAWETSDCTFEISTPFAVAFLSSLTEQPIAESGDLLLVAAARAENTGMAFNMAGTDVVEKGGPPVIAEPVVGTVRIETSADVLLVRPIMADGSPGPGTPIPVQDGAATVELKPSHRTIFYRIEARR
ncbi:MAG: cellulase family glycosylhydrolase, partial [Candidatus Brocadiia bacterium]